MDVVYTQHAEEKIKERKLIKVWVEETIKSPDKLEREGSKYYVLRKLNGMTLKVVYVKEKHIKVVTCYLI